MEQRTSSIVRRGGFAGMGWAGVNIVAAFSTGAPPAPDATGDTVRAYVADNRSPLMWAAAAFAVTIPLLITFVASLLGSSRNNTDERSSTIASVASIGLAVALVGWGLSYVVLVPVAVDDSLLASVGSDLLQYLYIATFVVALIGNVGAATTLLALGASEATVLGSIARRSATVLGGLTLVASAAGLANLDVASLATLAFLPFAVWVLATSLTILRHHGPTIAS